MLDTYLTYMVRYIHKENNTLEELLMKLIKTGNKHKVFGDDLVVLDKLSTDYVYTAGFNPDEGPYLMAEEVLEVKEAKVYGARQDKVNKLIKTFNQSNRSVGTILSGDKGIGKTLFTVMLSNDLREQGIPTILVTTNFPGMTAFLGSIKQEVMILFDEYEKVFNKEAGEQDKMLSLFDGLSNDKRLYVITVNDISKLSPYMLNRPGRFHYHIRFKYPTVADIKEYLTDKVLPEYHSEIPSVLTTALTNQYNYDKLRALTTELNQGYGVDEALEDLNISRTLDRQYTVVVHVGDQDIRLNGIPLDISKEATLIDIYDEYGFLSGSNGKDVADSYVTMYGLTNKDFQTDVDKGLVTLRNEAEGYLKVGKYIATALLDTAEVVSDSTLYKEITEEDMEDNVDSEVLVKITGLTVNLNQFV